MPFRAPIIKTIGRQAKIDFLSMSHALGFQWERSILASIAGIDGWPADLHVLITHGALRLYHSNGVDSRVITWLSDADAQYRIEQGEGTIVNSLEHMEAYARRTKMI